METKRQIQVVLVDDHSLVRDGIKSILESSGEVIVSGACSSGEEAIGMVRDLNPDVVLMDIIMQGMTGIEAARWIKEQQKDTKIILLSMEIKKALVTAGIQSGIDGYLLKDSPKEHLTQAIQEVMAGKKYFTEAITKLIFEDYFENHQAGRKREQKVIEGLTKREIEVLEQIAQGLSTREAAERLFISVKTVETHKAHILDKLGLRNTAEMILYAVKNKIIAI